MQPEQNFTLAEVTGALSGLDEAAQQTVLGALRQLVAQRELNRVEDEYTRSIFDFAITYHRAMGEGHSDSNIEGWYEGVREEAEDVLEQFAIREGPLSETEALVRNTAAVAYTFQLLEQADEDEEDVLDLGLLRNAGVDEDWLLQVFRDGMVQYKIAKEDADPDAARASVDHEYRVWSDFHYKLEPEHNDYILEPLALAMRARLQEEGFNLPELTAEGKYDEDDGEPRWQPAG